MNPNSMVINKHGTHIHTHSYRNPTAINCTFEPDEPPTTTTKDFTEQRPQAQQEEVLFLMNADRV